MSGHKFTEVDLQAERQERLDLQQGLQALAAEHAALRNRLDATLAGMSQGLRSTFAGEVAASRAWLNTARRPAESAAGQARDEDLARLRQAHREQTRSAEAGRTCLKELELARTQKADALGRAAAEQRVVTSQTLLQHGETLRLWYGRPALADWESQLDRAAQWIDQERYSEAQERLEAIRAELQEKAAQATDWETRHQRRLYLLKALRQVCADLGFAEIGEPAFAHPGERGSRILLTVDTHDRGRIDFNLTLEGLGSFSQMGDSHCPMEFDSLSRKLDEQFGIHTRFRPDTGQATPELRRKGEKDLPDDGARQTATTGGGL